MPVPVRASVGVEEAGRRGAGWARPGLGGGGVHGEGGASGAAHGTEKPVSWMSICEFSRPAGPVQ